MDFDLDGAQRRRLELLQDRIGATSPTVGRGGGGLPGEHDEELAAFVRSEDRLVGPDLSLLDRVLLVEEAARLAAPFNATALLLLAPLGGLNGISGPVAVVDGSDVPVRHGGHGVVAIEVSGDAMRWAAIGDGDRRPVASGLTAHAGLIGPVVWSEAQWSEPLDPRSVHLLGSAAEVAGAAQGAIDHVAQYLRQRAAFGRPLAQQQALRHRLSELAVDAAGTSVLVRYAADRGEKASISSSVASAAATAAALPPELHQLCGARGFLAEFGLSRWTMQLQALRVEMGGVQATALAHAEDRWP